MTFNTIVYMFTTCEGHFSIILGTVHRDSSLLTAMQKLLRKEGNLHVLRNVFPCIHGSHPEISSRSARDPEFICSHPKIIHAALMCSRFNVSRVTAHDMRMVCSLKTVDPDGSKRQFHSR